MERIPATPPIFKKLMWINYIVCAAIIAYGIVTLSGPIVATGVAGEATFIILNKQGAA